MSQIITSLLDTDYYKFTMSYAVMKTCERLGIDMPHVMYKFKCRNNKDLLPYKKKIEQEIAKFQNLKLTSQELSFVVNSLPIEEKDRDLPYARLFHMNLKQCVISVFERDGELNIHIEGPWFPAIMFEVPVLSIVNEVYFKDKIKDDSIAQANLFKFLKNTPSFYEFGTRRRRSKKWQEYVFKQGIKEGRCLSTSNVALAMKWGKPPIGTMAHEWLQGFQAISRDLRDFQKDALNHWLLTYRGKLGVALTDIVGVDAFLADWDSFFAKNFYTLRHDSGDPKMFVDKVIKRYKELDMKPPRVMFSDGLNDKTANDCLSYSSGHGINADPAIGTFATNNCGVDPLHIVIKLAKLNGQAVAKIPDTAGKTMCDDQSFEERLRKTFNIRNKR